jgi:hypothetical protein
MSQDIAYFRERAETERSRAQAASDEKVASVHRDMAGRYEALAQKAEKCEKLRIL